MAASPPLASVGAGAGVSRECPPCQAVFLFFSFHSFFFFFFFFFSPPSQWQERLVSHVEGRGRGPTLRSLGVS